MDRKQGNRRFVRDEKRSLEVCAEVRVLSATVTCVPAKINVEVQQV
jgi:hypothetical protein